MQIMLGSHPDIFFNASLNISILQGYNVQDQYTVLKKCCTKLDCLFYEMLFIRNINIFVPFSDHYTVEPRFNEPLYNERFSSAPQNYSKMYGTEPRNNEPRYNEILVITNTIQKPKRKIYLDITNKCQHVTKDEYETDEQG